MLNHPLISCDDHLDLNQLPADLWQERMPARMRDRAPHIEERGGRALWVCDGESWGPWLGKGAPPAGPKPIFTALDRGGVADLSARRPAVPKLRLQDMDRDGVHAHVIFGPVTSIRHPDIEFRDACYRAYNDWLEEFCAVAPDRFLGVPMLPPSPASALEEMRRLAGKGVFRQANLQIAVIDPPLRDAQWEPLLKLMADTGTVLAFHVTVFASALKAFDPLKGSPGATFLHAKSFVEQFIDPFVDLFAFGILERHPALRIVIAESGAGWLPWLVEELDYRHWRLWEAKEYWDDKGGISLVTKPSELFRRQIYTTFQQSPVTMRLLEFYGDNLLWASDYPHPDSIWPNSRATIERTMGHLPAAMIKKITHDNAAQLYGLHTGAAAAIA